MVDVKTSEQMAIFRFGHHVGYASAMRLAASAFRDMGIPALEKWAIGQAIERMREALKMARASQDLYPADAIAELESLAKQIAGHIGGIPIPDEK